MRQQGLARGVEAFKAGQFYAAHDIWEVECWQGLALGYEKTFYQGLIQLAVALHHQQQGNAVGFKRLLRQAHTKLWGLAFLLAPQPVLFQVNLEELLAQITCADEGLKST